MISCPRKWAWRSLDGVEFPSNAAAAFGTAVHAQLERWFKKGVRPDATSDVGIVAESALHLWPVPKDVSNVEFHIGVVIDDCEYHGYQDVEALQTFEPQNSIGFSVIVGAMVGDHKTTSDFKWAKSEEQLSTDPQALIYALAAMQRHAVDYVELRWVYMRKSKPFQARKVSLVVTRDYVESFVRDHINPLARQMERIRGLGLKALQLEPDARACSAYGGCSYRDLCNLSDIEKFDSIITQDTLAQKLRKGDSMAELTLAEKMAARVAQLKEVSQINPPEASKPAAIAQPVAQSPQVVAAPPAAPQTAPASNGESLLARMQAKAVGSGASIPAEPRSEVAPVMAQAVGAIVGVPPAVAGSLLADLSKFKSGFVPTPPTPTVPAAMKENGDPVRAAKPSVPVMSAQQISDALNQTRSIALTSLEWRDIIVALPEKLSTKVLNQLLGI